MAHKWLKWLMIGEGLIGLKQKRYKFYAGHKPDKPDMGRTKRGKRILSLKRDNKE